MAAAAITEEEWDRIVAVNLRSVFLCMKYEIPLMLKQGGGSIVIGDEYSRGRLCQSFSTGMLS